MTTLALVIFCGTYLLIAARRLRWLPLGRPGGALLGAVLMVLTGVLTPAASYAALDLDTLLLLFAMMLLTAQFAEAGFFPWVSARLLGSALSDLQLLRLTVWLAGCLSAIFVNDTICLVLTPVIVMTCRMRRLPLGPYLMALATSANIGSAATLVGNPQNMLIGNLSQIAFLRFFLLCAPAAMAGLAINAWLLERHYSRSLVPVDSDTASPATDPEPDVTDVADTALPVREPDWQRIRIVAVASAAVLVAFLAGMHLGYAALGGGVLAMTLSRRDPSPLFARIDWTVLVFFASLFVVVGGLEQTGLLHEQWEHLAPQMRYDQLPGLALFATMLTLGSNLVSNVPMVLLTGPHLDRLGDPELGWLLMAWITTIAGNFTLLGSVANIIVAEGARRAYDLSFGEYLRYGWYSTVLIMTVGIAIIVALH
ncbi:MAG: putative transporter [bacterium]|nr:putative transporter [bacterium]